MYCVGIGGQLRYSFLFKWLQVEERANNLFNNIDTNLIRVWDNENTSRKTTRVAGPVD